MIGSGGKYYQIEIGISDPRQRDVWWREVEPVYAYSADAIAEAKRTKAKRVRVLRVDCECVWANNEALVANGDKVS